MPPDPSADSLRFHQSFLEALRGAWRSVARPEQLAPEGAWTTWVFLGGRGAGKTRSGSEFVLERVAAGEGRIHLIAPTAADVRDVMLEGPAGILAIAPPHLRPAYQPTLRKLTWPNGAQALLFSGDEPDRLRGPQCGTAWIDELCAMRAGQEVLDNAYMGLRVGKDPRALITTTPRPLRYFKALLAREGQDVVVTRSSSYANRDNLAPAFFAQVVGKYAGTRLGRQELEAELLTDTPGALWHMDRIEELRARIAPAPFERVVVAIDPAVTHGPDSDETGILVVALGSDGDAYVLDDLSGRFPPEEWARRAIGAYHAHCADRIIGEANNGGALVEHTLRSVDPTVPFRAVHASRGKLTRAEPVSALYEQGRAHHVGVFGPLEDQLTSYDGSRSGASPDRLDALVWGITELMLTEPPGTFIKTDAMLRPAAGGELRPVALPREGVTELFACAAVTETEPDALAMVYIGLVTEHSRKSDRTVTTALLLDWDLFELTPALFERLYDDIAARLGELSAECGFESVVAQLVIDPTGLGAVLIEEGQERGLDVSGLDSEELLKRTPVQRAADFGVNLGARRVKIAAPAFEKAVNYKGVHRNHLLAQMRGFKLDAERGVVAPLLAAAAAGVLEALRADRSLDNFRRLGAAARRERDPERAPAPQRIVPLEQHLREQLAAAQSARELAAARVRAENEVGIERENERTRAALAERARRQATEEHS